MSSVARPVPARAGPARADQRRPRVRGSRIWPWRHKRADRTPEEQRLLHRPDSRLSQAGLPRVAAAGVRAPAGLGAGAVVPGSLDERLLAARLAGSWCTIGLELRLDDFAVRAYRYSPRR